MYARALAYLLSALSVAANVGARAKEALARGAHWLLRALVVLSAWILSATSGLGYGAAVVAVFAALAAAAAVYLRYPFWARSPVFHRWDLWRYAYSAPFVIQTGEATKTKFFRPEAVRTARIADLDEADLAAAARLLQGHYARADDVFGDITSATLRAELSSGAAPGFISLYRAPGGADIAACMSSRPAELFFAARGGAAREPAYVLDHICVRKTDSGPKGSSAEADMGRALLHTHEHAQRAAVSEIKMSLFRREGALCAGVVPLVEYASCTFRIPRARPPPLPPGARITAGTPQCRADVAGAVESATGPAGGALFAAAAREDVVFELIRAKMLLVFCLKRGGATLAVYFFRDLRRQAEALGGGVLALAASVCNTRSDALFFAGFLHALRALRRGRRRFAAVTIDALGSNGALCLHMRALAAPAAEVPAAYYLYNGVHPGSPLPAARCFVLV